MVLKCHKGNLKIGGIVRSGFLGFGEMSDDEQNNVMLFVILALSTECVLEGLLTSAPERFWVFHAVAAALCVWALSSGVKLAIQLSSISGVATFFNELELVWGLEDRARLITPAFVLLAASITLGWKIFSSGGTVPMPSQVLTQRAASNRKLTSGYEPYLVFLGAILVIYSLAIGDWLEREKWFGLFSDSVGFSEIRKIYQDLDISGDVYTTYLDFGYLLSYASAGVGVAVYLGKLTNRLIVSSKIMLALAIGSLFATFWHTAFVVDLLGNRDEIPLGVPAWVCSVGLGLISGCAFKNREG